MNMKDIGKKVAGMGATLLGGAIGGPGGAKLGSMVAVALGLDTDEPDAIAKALDLDPEAAIKLRQIESDERVTLQKILAEQRLAEIQAETEAQKTVNETMRAELLASDRYRAGWRPAFGYVMAFNMAAISIAFFAAVIAVIIKPTESGEIAAGFATMLASFVVIFSLGLGVLGVQVHDRSVDKRVAAGINQAGTFGKIGDALGLGAKGGNK